MAISVISVSSDSSEESVGASVERVILFGTILTIIHDTMPTISPPTTHTDTIVTPTEMPSILPTVLPTVPPSPDHTPALPDITPASPDYSPVMSQIIQSDPSKDPSSNHIPPLPAISPFLSSADDTTDSDTPDTPLSPTHDTPFIEITPSTQRLPIVPHSSLEAPSDFHSDASSDSSSRHSLPDHSSPDLPSTSVRPSRKRRRYPMTSVAVLSPVFGALSPVCADLIPLPKRIRDSDYLADVEVDSRENSELSRSRGTDVGVNDYIERVDESCLEPEIDLVQATIEAGTDTRDMVEGGDDMATHPVMSDDVQEAAQEERVAEGTYETLGSLVHRFHDHTVAILVDRVKKMPNIRSGASMTQGEVEELVVRRVAKEMEAREAAMNLEPLNKSGDEQEGENEGNGNRGNGGNGNGGDKGNGNGENRNGNGGNGNG
ncbi:hypothetical protein Tco_0296612 [Tanacetum coccineum]